MADSTEAQMLREVIKIKDELLAALTAGMDSLRGSIIALSTEHHNALLEQERRNATFAERRRVDDLAERVAERGNEIALLRQERSQVVEDVAELRSALTRLVEHGETIAPLLLKDPDDAHWVSAARKRSTTRWETILHVWRSGLGQLAAIVISVGLSALGIIHFAAQLLGR